MQLLNDWLVKLFEPSSFSTSSIRLFVNFSLNDVPSVVSKWLLFLISVSMWSMDPLLLSTFLIVVSTSGTSSSLSSTTSWVSSSVLVSWSFFMTIFWINIVESFMSYFSRLLFLFATPVLIFNNFFWLFFTEDRLMSSSIMSMMMIWFFLYRLLFNFLIFLICFFNTSIASFLKSSISSNSLAI